MNEKTNLKGKLDKPLFFSSLIVLAAISVPIIMNPEGAMTVVNTIRDYILYKFGIWYVLFGFFTVGFCVYIGFSKYGRIKLGDPDTKPDYSTFSWAAMLFCGGIGGTVIYWGTIEWVYYFSGYTPLHITPGSPQAYEMAAAMGPYHWGGICWTIYIVCGVACAYMMYVRKSPVFRISEACRGFLGNKVDGILGKIIDVGFMFGLIGAAATAFGLQTPFIANLLNKAFGVPDTNVTRLIILVGVATIFGITSYMGISKGMKRISDANVILAIALLVVVLFSGSAVYTLKMSMTSIGILAENFITMSSWMDPQGVSGGFPEWWTVFYWAWAAMYAPFYGLFFAKISKGRTMGQMIAGTVGFGSLGCFTVFEILGGYGMFMNSNGKIDMLKNQAELGDAGAIVALFDTLPMSQIILVLFLIVIVLFSATTYDATSGVLASVSQYQLDEKGEAKPWLRLLWAGLLVMLPAGFILSGSQLGPLQTITIIFALPVTIICIITVISFFKMVKQDVAEGKFAFPEKK